MFSFLKNLFVGGGLGGSGGQPQPVSQEFALNYVQELEPGEPDDLALAAVNKGNRSQFVQLLMLRGVWIIMRIDRGEYDGDMQVLEYDEGERRVLPVFSSLMEAHAFVHTIDISEMLALQYLHVSCMFLTHNDLSEHKVVLNPYAGATTEITDPDMQALRTLVMEMHGG